MVVRNSDNLEPAIDVASVGQLYSRVAIGERHPLAIPCAVRTLLHRAMQVIELTRTKRHQAAVCIHCQPDEMKRITILVDPAPRTFARSLPAHVGRANMNGYPRRWLIRRRHSILDGPVRR